MVIRAEFRRVGHCFANFSDPSHSPCEPIPRDRGSPIELINCWCLRWCFVAATVVGLLACFTPATHAQRPQALRNHADLEIVMGTSDGLFAVYRNLNDSSRAGKAGHLVFWRDDATEQTYLFNRLIYSRLGRAQGLLSVSAGFGIPLDRLAVDSLYFADGVRETKLVAPDVTPWVLATERNIIALGGSIHTVPAGSSETVTASGGIAPAPGGCGIPSFALGTSTQSSTLTFVSACNDGNICTNDICVDGKCTFQPATAAGICRRFGCFVQYCSGGTCDGALIPRTGGSCTLSGGGTGACCDGVCCANQCCDGECCQADWQFCTGNGCSECRTDFDCTQGLLCSELDWYNSQNQCVHDADPCGSPRTCCSDTQSCQTCCDGGDCPDDGNPCTQDTCVNHACIYFPFSGGSCEDDGNACTDELCIDGGCTHPPNSDPCDDDGNPCTDDICSNGICSHPPSTTGQPCAPDEDQCTDDVCVNGACSHPFNNDPCDDDDLCTENDTCLLGRCTGLTIDCEDNDLCTTEIGCDRLSGCIREDKDCDDLDPCTDDSCDSTTGMCSHDDVFPRLPADELCGVHGCTITMFTRDFIRLNNDDDNLNGIADYTETGPITGENDLVSMGMVTDGCPPASGFDCPDHCGPDHWHPAPSPGGWRLLNSSDRDPLVFEDLESWPPPVSYLAEGRAITSACGSRWSMLLTFADPSGACGDDSAPQCCKWQSDPVPVVKVGTLTWEKAFDDNLDLDPDPNNGGLRIFPGKLTPNDANPSFRSRVNLVATVDPPIPGVRVIFTLWDVDDPFNELNPTMANVGVIDSNSSGPDNRPVGIQPGQKGRMTDNDGRATASYTVSMQPGNNFRGSATLLEGVLTSTPPQVRQSDADALSVTTNADGFVVRNGNFSGYKVPLVWSQMLTVWRKLHVEVDSMASEPTTVTARSPDWDQFNAIQLLAGEATTIFTGIGLENGPSLAAGEVDHYEGGLLSYTTPSRDFPVRFNRSIFTTAEGWRAEIRVDGTVSPAEELDLLWNIGDVRDDDTLSGQLPRWYLVGSDSFIRAAYEASYIEVVQDDTLNPRRQVAFDLHLEDLELQAGVGYDNSQDVFSEDAYWASLVVFAYQPAESVDADPDPVSGLNNSGPTDNPNYDSAFTFGVTIEDADNASVIYVEVHRDLGLWAGNDLPHTIAHEMGHAAGPNINSDIEHNEFGLMRSGAPVTECCFSAQTLRRFRENTRW